MNEAETRAELIDPALQAAGWGVVADSRTRREVIAPGRIMGGGKRARPSRPITCWSIATPSWRRSRPRRRQELHRGRRAGEGLCRLPADPLRLRHQRQEIYRIDMQTGAEGLVDAWPTPEELWAATFAEPNRWRDRFAAVPLQTDGRFEPRYYQYNAIQRTLDAIADGSDRILLTLATGTGKTVIAFQIAWKLFQARWNIRDWKADGEPTRRPRILFLADRNILADQAYNSFDAFGDDARVRIKPERNPQERQRAEERQRVLHDLPDFMTDGGSRGRAAVLSATIRPTSSTASSSTNAIAAAPRTRASGAPSSNISRPPCRSA